MSHLFKGFCFFVIINAIFTGSLCWYSFLIGHGFTTIGLPTTDVGLVIILGLLFGGGGWAIVTGISADS